MFFQTVPIRSQTIKIKKSSLVFSESITFSEPVDYTDKIAPMIRLFDLPQFNSETYLKKLEKANILKKQGSDYWFIVPIQEDFGDAVCYVLFDSTLFWFGGYKPFAWSKDGKNKREAEIVVWVQYLITPGKGIVEAYSNILDLTGITHIDMKTFYANLKGAHLPFEERKKPKVKK